MVGDRGLVGAGLTPTMVVAVAHIGGAQRQ